MKKVELTSPDKIVFEGVTKQQVFDYYQSVAGRMMPYVGGRNLALVMCPKGVEEACFYKKNADGTNIVIHSRDELLYHVQMNAIEFHTWGSLADTPDKPDIMVFDLDPDAGVSLSVVRQGAIDLKNILEELGLVSFLKTSGGKGYHIVVPFAEAGDWENFSGFAGQIAKIMEAKCPKRYTTNIRKDARGNKIFVDWLRNGRGATSAAPYSLRAKAGAAISSPISWDELKKITPNGITIKNITKRLKQNDPWAEFFKIQKRQKLCKQIYGTKG